MTEAVSPPALAAVVSLGLRDFLRAPVAEQVRLKSSLEAIVERAAAALARDSRLVLDAPQGFVVVVLAGPLDALELAQRVRAGADGLALSIGLDFGPVRAVDHERRGSGLVGDGIVAGMALAAAAAPGTIAASRGFREVLAWAAPERAAELAPGGNYTDEAGRSHEMHAWNPRARSARRRRLVAFGALGIAAILGAGVAARLLTRVEPGPAAVLEFNVAPRGEVLVDGVVRGMTPPLTRLEVEPGPRVIEIRAAGYPPLKLNVSLAPQQTMTIEHTFAKAAPRRERSFVDDLRRRLGL